MFTCILRRIAIALPLTAPYDGPYKVVARKGRVFKVLIKSKVETVTADRVKPILSARLKMNALDNLKRHRH